MNTLGEPVLLALPALYVGQVLTGLRALPEDNVTASHLLLGDSGGVFVAIILLAADHIVSPESPAEVHGELYIGVGHQVGAKTLFRQYLRHRSLSGGDRLPPEGGRSGWPGPHPCVDGTPNLYRGHGLGVGLGEEQALFGEGIQSGGLYPIVAVGADVVLPQGVYDHQDDVRSCRPAREVLLGQPRHSVGESCAPGRAEQGRPGRTRASGPQEVPARKRPLLAHSRPTPEPLPPKVAL